VIKKVTKIEWGYKKKESIMNFLIVASERGKFI